LFDGLPTTPAFLTLTRDELGEPFFPGSVMYQPVKISAAPEKLRAAQLAQTHPVVTEYVSGVAVVKILEDDEVVR
jgi:hypothetical protein